MKKLLSLALACLLLFFALGLWAGTEGRGE